MSTCPVCLVTRWQTLMLFWRFPAQCSPGIYCNCTLTKGFHSLRGSGICSCTLTNEFHSLSGSGIYICSCTLTNGFHNLRGSGIWNYTLTKGFHVWEDHMSDCFSVCFLPNHMVSRTPSLEDLSPFLEGGCCNARCSPWMFKDSPHRTMQHKTTFQCSLGVLAGVSVLSHSPSLGVLAGGNVLWHSPGLSVLAGGNVLWCSPGLGVLAGGSVLSHSPSLGVLAGVSVLWHSPSLGVLAGGNVLWQSANKGGNAFQCICVDRFCIVLFSALRKTHCTLSHVILNERLAFYSAFWILPT